MTKIEVGLAWWHDSTLSGPPAQVELLVTTPPKQNESPSAVARSTLLGLLRLLRRTGRDLDSSGIAAGLWGRVLKVFQGARMVHRPEKPGAAGTSGRLIGAASLLLTCGSAL